MNEKKVTSLYLPVCQLDAAAVITGLKERSMSWLYSKAMDEYLISCEPHKQGPHKKAAIVDETGEVIVEAEEPCADPVIVKKELRPAPPKAPECVPFDRFWAAWPKKVDIKDARKVWAKLKPGEELFEKIRAHCTTAYLDTAKNFIPGPAKYLRGEKWNDEIISNKAADPFNTEVPSFERRCENTFDVFNGNTYDGELNS